MSSQFDHELFDAPTWNRLVLQILKTWMEKLSRLVTGLVCGPSWMEVQMWLLKTLQLLFQRERMLMKFLLLPLQQQMKCQSLREHHLNLLPDQAQHIPAAAVTRSNMALV